MVDKIDALPAGGAQSLRRAVALLRVVAAAQERGVRVVDVVESTGLSRPTAHRMLQVLAEENVVERDAGTKRYKIGTELALLGMARSNRFPIRALAQPFLLNLSGLVQDTIFLTVRQGADSIGIERITGSFPVQARVTDVGVRRPLGVGVGGIAILSALPPEEVERIVQSNHRRLAMHRIAPGELLQRVQQARDCGFAWAPTGLVPGTSAVSVPVVSKADGVLAAISVAAVSRRLPSARLPAVTEWMFEEARRIAERADQVGAANGSRPLPTRAQKQL